LFAATAACTVVAALGAAHYFVRIDEYRGFSATVYVDIPRGTSTLGIGRMLAEAGVVRNPLLFALAKLTKPRAVLQAGEYEFSKAAAPAEVYARIARGDVYLVELLVPEGSNMFEIAGMVEQAGFGTAKEFLKAARSPELIRDLDPRAPSLEGYLFPSTYRFPRRTTPEQICRAMTREFRNVWESIGGGVPPHEVVTLASLVETEAVRAEEREKIAGVYRNRLRLGMKLDCDPTVEYAARLSNQWKGTIHKSDLTRRHAYNTYVRPGLPPGPIANPGAESLKAALNPAPTDALYFVAAPGHNGAHVFSKEYSGHQRAVSSYRRGENAARKKATAPRVAPRKRR
jgi:UPF0755 protein